MKHFPRATDVCLPRWERGRHREGERESEEQRGGKAAKQEVSGGDDTQRARRREGESYHTAPPEESQPYEQWQLPVERRYRSEYSRTDELRSTQQHILVSSHLEDFDFSF